MLPQLRVLHLAEAGIFAKLPICVVGHPSLSLVGIHYFSAMTTGRGKLIMKSIVKLHVLKEEAGAPVNMGSGLVP